MSESEFTFDDGGHERLNPNPNKDGDSLSKTATPTQPDIVEAVTPAPSDASISPLAITQPRRVASKQSDVLDFKIRAMVAGKRRSFGVGIATICTSSRHPRSIVLGCRRGSDGAGTFAVPGGHLGFGESIEAAAQRELLEETGMKTNDIRLVSWENVYVKEDNYHYVIAFVVCDVRDQEPVNIEKDKCDGWFWAQWDNKILDLCTNSKPFPMPAKLFAGLRQFRQNPKSTSLVFNDS